MDRCECFDLLLELIYPYIFVVFFWLVAEHLLFELLDPSIKFHHLLQIIIVLGSGRLAMLLFLMHFGQ